MPSFDGEEEDVFFDTFDCFRTSVDSDSSGHCSAESPELEFSSKFQYDLWASELMSVQERRNRFLRRMGIGLDDFVLSQSDRLGETEECMSCKSVENIDMRRVFESRGAVSSSHSSLDDGGRKEYCCIRDLDSGKKFFVHDVGEDGLLSMLEEVGSDKLMTLEEFEAFLGLSNSVQQFTQQELVVPEGKRNGCADAKGTIHKSWWKSFIWKRYAMGMCKNGVSGKSPKFPKTTRMKVRQQKKKCMEFTALYKGQEIKGHKGAIRILRFSSSGWYLASGGEDTVVRVWQIRGVETSSKCFASNGSSKTGKMMIGRQSCNSAPVIIPKEIFKIEETPLHEFHGHTGGILDLSWSNSDCLLTSSEDGIVRLWKVGCDSCLKVFPHNDFVTCVQFNPIDERYFISGSIDGKVRIWGVSENRVVDWVDTRDIVTAVCYQPDGKGFVVGSVAGICQFYNYSGSGIHLDRRFYVKGRKKSIGKPITCLQFSPTDSEKVMISSADPNVRIFEKVDVIHKLRGLRKSKSQSYASFTSDGRYIVSVDEDSHVYIWNYNVSRLSSLKGAKTIRSCERFSSEGVSVAVPWPGIDRRGAGLGFNNVLASSSPQRILEPSIWLRDPDCFSLGVCFFTDSPSRGSAATWPEEKLIQSSTTTEDHRHSHHFHCLTTISATWSLVIVTASHDGSIRSFHNFGLPVRL
ncbi:putative transcription factor WD40-like family [Dioscorea sansibarensis]